MESESADRTRIAARAVSTMQTHPVITSVMVSCIVLGAIGGMMLLTGDWSLARRLAAGMVAGGGVGILVCGTKMIG